MAKWLLCTMTFIQLQVLKEYTGRIDALDKKTIKKEEAEEKSKSASNDYVPDYMMPAMQASMMPGMGNLAIMGPQTMQPQGGFGQQAGGFGQQGMHQNPMMMTPQGHF